MTGTVHTVSTVSRHVNQCGRKPLTLHSHLCLCWKLRPKERGEKEEGVMTKGQRVRKRTKIDKDMQTNDHISCISHWKRGFLSFFLSLFFQLFAHTYQWNTRTVGRRTGWSVCWTSSVTSYDHTFQNGIENPVIQFCLEPQIITVRRRRTVIVV